MTDELLHVYMPIVNKSKNADGTLTVFGKVGGSDLDLDQQVLNEEWLAQELPTWFKSGANVREQHQQIAAGVGKELTNEGDNWYLKATVVDPVSIAKVEHGVLQGYSVGIKAGKVFTKSARAPKGEIVGGRIVEVSLVDRPANETCKLTIAKSADTDELINLEDPEYVEWDAETQKWVAADIEKDASGGMPPLDKGGKPRYPITDAASLKKAMRALGRAKAGDREEVMSHIKSRAKALGLSNLLTDTYKSVDITKADEAPYIKQVLEGLAQLIICEAEELAKGEDERCDISQLLNAVYALWCFWESEAENGEVPSPDTEDEEDMTLNLSAVVDLVKSASANDATEEDKATVDELRKALGITDAESVSKADHDNTVATLTQGLEQVKSELAEVKKAAAPGGPVKTRTSHETEKASLREEYLEKAAKFDQLAEVADSQDMAKGYRELAEIERIKASR